MNLLDNLKARYEVAKNFTKDYHEQVKQAVKDYKAENPEVALDKVDVVEVSQNKYKLTYPLIFVNHEAMMASMFDRVPELIISGKGKKDEEKKLKIIAAYEYLKDKLSFEWILNDVAWWFILAGMATAHATYDQQSKQVPVIDEMGQPMMDADGNPLTREEYQFDDPVVEVGDPLKEVYSPESKFTVDFDKVPYYFRESLMDPEEVKRVYKKDVEADATIDISNDKKSESTDLQRVRVRFYYGNVPKENKGEVDEWSYDAKYFVVMTEKKILHKEKINQLYCKGLKLHGVPNEFFGFGLAKLLRRSQNEKSTRRSQQIRYADVMSMPKVAIDETTKVDENAINDPRVGVALLYSEKKPEYMVPPPMPDTLIAAEQHVDSDAQQISGLMDLSTGSQQTMTDKATGQAIFAEASERRVRTARRKLIEFYKQLVIMVLKLAQEKWDTVKMAAITDEEGNEQQVEVSSGDLKDINFDTDIDIDGESMIVNKDILRQQAIELYNITKDDALVERTEVFKDLMSTGFNKRNPEKYIASPELEPGTQLTNPQTGEIFLVDETGKPVKQEQQETLSAPTGEVGTATTQAGIEGGMNRGL